MRKKIPALAAVASVLLLYGCDMTFIGTRPSEVPFLIITGLPIHTEPGDMADILVHNQDGAVARADYRSVVADRQGDSVTLRIPLLCAGSGEAFRRTGTFLVSFDAHVDALTRVTVTPDDGVAVPFDSGNGSLDISDIPDSTQVRVPHLAISGLPAHTQSGNVSEVLVHNQGGAVARGDHSAAVATPVGNTVTLSIPLLYAGSGAAFSQTGTFLVSFDVHVDAFTRVTVTSENRVPVTFVSGSGSIDVADIPEPPPVQRPYLTMTGLPANVRPYHFSDIAIWNMEAVVARAHSEITVIVDGGGAVARIPLLRQSSSEYFRDTGRFLITFVANIDAFTRIQRTHDDRAVVVLEEGSGTFSAVNLGFFHGGLANPSDTAPPIVMAGTVFEMNGSYFRVDVDTPAIPRGLSTSSLAYVFAVATAGGVEFELLSETPAWSPSRNGWYGGDRRALFKMAHVRESGGTSAFVAKTTMAEGFRQLHRFTLANDYLVLNAPIPVRSFDGAGGPLTEKLTLYPGVYVFSLSGGGGGGGRGVPSTQTWLPPGAPGPIVANSLEPSGAVGGYGGRVIELVTVSRPTTFTVITGAGGSAGGSVSSFQAPTGVPYLAGPGGRGGQPALVFSPDSLDHADDGSTRYHPGYFLAAAGGGGGAGGFSHVRVSNAWTRGITTGFPGGVIGGLSVAGVERTILERADGRRVYVFNGLPPMMEWLGTNGAEAWGGSFIAGDHAGSRSGEGGGNNRNGTRGGGGSAGGPGGEGGAGSVRVYRISD